MKTSKLSTPEWKGAFKSELDRLRDFEKTANDAAFIMVEVMWTLSLAVKALEHIPEKKELTDEDTKVLYGLDTMLRKIIADLNSQYARIADHGINLDKSRKETARQARVSA